MLPVYGLQHWMELRRRLWFCVITIGVISAILFYFANELYLFVAAPLRHYLLATDSSMIATEVASPFLAPFKLSLVLAVVLAAPVWLYQLWRFIAPGLYQHEKRIALSLLVASISLFYLGLVFAYYGVFPLVFGFFSQVGPEGIQYTPDISHFLTMVLTLFLAFGLAFQIPIAVLLCVLSGLVTPASLSHKRPYVIVACFIVSMLLTPPDVISQALLALPMWLLFEMGIVLSWLIKRPVQKQAGQQTQD